MLGFVLNKRIWLRCLLSWNKNRDYQSNSKAKDL